MARPRTCPRQLDVAPSSREASAQDFGHDPRCAFFTKLVRTFRRTIRARNHPHTDALEMFESGLLGGFPLSPFRETFSLREPESTRIRGRILSNTSQKSGILLVVRGVWGGIHARAGWRQRYSRRLATSTRAASGRRPITCQAMESADWYRHRSEHSSGSA